MKIPLIRSSRSSRLPESYLRGRIEWNRSVPFAKSTRGVLLHRVKSGETFLRDGVRTHDHVGFWCGNGANHGQGSKVEFYESPPDEYLVCERCEESCKRHGEKSASELAGRHIHVGRIVAKRACCEVSN